MATIKPFKGLRPPKKWVAEIASRPYDVLNSEEALKEAKGNEKSLYHIIKPEIDFPKGKNKYDEDVYKKAFENFQAFQQKGWLIKDKKEMYYIYAQTMNERSQYGLVVGVHVEDYLQGIIKKHELTRKDKEEDRMKHIHVNHANLEPVFLAYQKHSQLNNLVQKEIKKEPEYDFTSFDSVKHQFWVIDNEETIKKITDFFTEIPYLYIADGHHRSAASALVGVEKAIQNTKHTGKEEYNYFMAVCFPSDQLAIMDYNRVIKDLNGLTTNKFLQLLEKNFHIQKEGNKIYRPKEAHHFSLYIKKNWYSLIAKKGTYNDQDPIESLDVTISSRFILDEILNIKDLRTDKRVDFVGGLRGLEELKRRVDSNEMIAALSFFPISMEKIIEIADSGKIMPPKTTWFEPKLRSGLVVHTLD